jgi:hypothetical protein
MGHGEPSARPSTDPITLSVFSPAACYISSWPIARFGGASKIGRNRGIVDMAELAARLTWNGRRMPRELPSAAGVG